MRRYLLAILLAILAMLSSAAAWYRLSARVPEAQAPWSQAAPMPSARSEMPATVLEGKIYVPGGIGSFGRTLATFEAYDPESDSWQSLANLPVGLHHTGIAAAAGKLYVMGGYTDLTFTANVTAVWAYDPEADTWTHVSEMPSARAAHALVALDDKIYVIGGVGPQAQALWIFDPSDESWNVSRRALPTAREHLSAVAIDGRIYAIAGRWQNENLGTLEIYDPEAERWTAGPDLPTPRSGLTAAAIDGQIHVAGGEELGTGRTFDAHEVYDLELNSWQLGTPLLAPRHGLASAALDDRWYIIGGATRAGWETVLSLTDKVDVLTVSANSTR